MEQPAFESQLSNEELSELGRLTVNFGYVELLLDWLIAPAFGLKVEEAIRAFVSPLNLDRKIKLLRSRVHLCEQPQAQARMHEALDIISAIKDDRNTIVHGYWALQNGVGAAVFNRKQAPEAAQVRSASELADGAARATRFLYKAFDILNGRDPSKSAPDVIAPNGDGSFTVIRKEVGGA